MGYETVYGGTLPADLWKAGMVSYLDGKPVRQLPGVDPAHLLAPGRPVDNQVVMIDVRGQSADDADPTLRSRGLVVEIAADQTPAWRLGALGNRRGAVSSTGFTTCPGSTVKLTVRG